MERYLLKILTMMISNIPKYEIVSLMFSAASSKL